jgi:small-conductance mechanosensitive channel
MDLLKELKALLPQLGNPKFLHHLLEPVLLWGILFGVIAWMLSLWVVKDRKAQVCSLMLIALSAFTVFPLMHYRQKATPITAPSSRLLNEQNERRRDFQWVYYALGSLAVLGLFMTGEGKGKAGTLITTLITVGGVASVVVSLWLHEKEISLFHIDARKPLRSAVPAPPAPATASILRV